MAPKPRLERTGHEAATVITTPVEAVIETHQHAGDFKEP
jgi:hypothetical protein